MPGLPFPMGSLLCASPSCWCCPFPLRLPLLQAASTALSPGCPLPAQQASCFLLSEASVSDSIPARPGPERSNI